jgi:hypothetical protein
MTDRPPESDIDEPNPPRGGLRGRPDPGRYERWAEVYDGEDNPVALREEQHNGPRLRHGPARLAAGARRRPR